MTDHDHLPLTHEENEEVWTKVFDRIRRKRRRRNIAYGAIGLLLIFCCAIGYRSFVMPDVYMANGNPTEITLKDGSKVTLSAGAQLTVQKSFPADTREVTLKGDAVFRVTKSKEHPFIVHGASYDTKVLGAIFKVVQNGATYKVHLYEGKVLVYRKDRTEEVVKLKPKEQFTNFGNLHVASVITISDNKSVQPKATTASFTFKECSLKDAVHAIEQGYGIHITYPAELDEKKISVTLPDAAAGLLVQTLALQLNLTFKKKNDTTFELEK
ncbi:transmembrane sensor [Chryseobacterium sp. SORGH_AS909]|uniref:FecR family protein n=1 Tax=unclassified Chryseobacterium TaxID=2593645 RepID=UPI00278B4479|nr:MULTISPECIES: FecR family protein [unclassified Chryseobacterium]MDQ1101596.1 transmembrane sensor [Chryseobacterium sp. SORGH_AS_1048]MDR6085039.1 transmembrane sensor [Chryseobacterium sp. SORGH_AS_0909]MDR6129394.1 transmembrane sensor [Chryseobacterium sp. SORGH_AS_1175]MDT3408476.1 transmembrane sensor [Pseudacidovorax intermedius]